MSRGPGPKAPNQKAKNFGPTMRRLIGTLRPERGLIALALLLTRRAGRRTSLAFGPHLVAGAVLALALA